MVSMPFASANWILSHISCGISLTYEICQAHGIQGRLCRTRPQIGVVGRGASHRRGGESLATEHRHQQVSPRLSLVPQPVDLVEDSGRNLR